MRLREKISGSQFLFLGTVAENLKEKGKKGKEIEALIVWRQKAFNPLFSSCLKEVPLRHYSALYMAEPLCCPADAMLQSNCSLINFKINEILREKKSSPFTPRANLACWVPDFTFYVTFSGTFSHPFAALQPGSSLYLLRSPCWQCKAAQTGSPHDRCPVHVCSYHRRSAPQPFPYISRATPWWRQHPHFTDCPKPRPYNISGLRLKGWVNLKPCVLSPVQSCLYTLVKMPAGDSVFYLKHYNAWLAVRGQILNGWNSLIDCVKILWSFRQTP